MSIYRARTAGTYVFFEMLPSFLLGNLVFIFILLMFQMLRLSESIIIHGVPTTTVLQLVAFMTISFLPACIPVSLLFSILLTYGKMSSDSEIVAFKACGLHLGHLLMPAMVLSTLVGLLSAYVSFFGAPWGNRNFELLITKILSTKAAATVQEGVFSEGFFDLVLYADKVDSQNGRLQKVFIYDERDPTMPVTVIATQGAIVNYDPNFPGQGVTLRLMNGDIHRTSQTNYTKVDFQTYDINLVNTAGGSSQEKSPQSYTYDDLQASRDNPNKSIEERRMLNTEYHKRWALAAACLVFGMLGVGGGTVTNRRAVRASGFLVSLAIMVSYWLLYVFGDSLARQGKLPPFIAMWTVNVIFTGLGIWSLKKAW